MIGWISVVIYQVRDNTRTHALYTNLAFAPDWDGGEPHQARPGWAHRQRQGRGEDGLVGTPQQLHPGESECCVVLYRIRQDTKFVSGVPDVRDQLKDQRGEHHQHLLRAPGL